MKGLVFDKPGEPLKLVDNLEKPKPGTDQVLVKPVAAAINPLDHIMLNTGLLVLDWPCVLGCDAGGVVEEIGSAVKDIKVGDKVCGCTRSGQKGYATFQEYHLMDARFCIKVPAGISLQQACTIGGGVLTAGIGLVGGLNVELPAGKAPNRDEWLVVLGGASSVGQFVIQLANISGFKVLASCSPKTKDVALSKGASETFSYRDDEATQFENVKKITGGNFSRVFDAVAQKPDFAFKVLGQLSTASGEKYFTSTDDWSEWTLPAGLNVDRIHLGLIGREGSKKMNDTIAAFIPNVAQYLESGLLKPLAYEEVGPVGFEGILNAMERQSAGQAGGSKIIARVSTQASSSN